MSKSDEFKHETQSESPTKILIDELENAINAKKNAEADKLLSKLELAFRVEKIASLIKKVDKNTAAKIRNQKGVEGLLSGKNEVLKTVISFKKLSILKYLVAQNYMNYINIKDALFENNENCLHLAVNNNAADIVEFLIAETKCNVNKKNGAGQTALHYASGCKIDQKSITDEEDEIRARMIRPLGKEINVNNIFDTFNKTALHYAVANGFKAVTKELLLVTRALIPNLSHLDQERIFTGNLETDKELTGYLLESGKANKADLLMGAIMYANSRGLVRHLITEHKVDVNKVDSDHNNALCVATYNNCEGIVQELCDAKANVDFQDCETWTALRLAAHDGNQTIVEILVKANADLTIKDKVGLTVEKVAEKEGHTTIAAYLKQQAAAKFSENTAKSPVLLTENSSALEAKPSDKKKRKKTKSKNQLNNSSQDQTDSAALAPESSKEMVQEKNNPKTDSAEVKAEAGTLCEAERSVSLPKAQELQDHASKLEVKKENVPENNTNNSIETINKLSNLPDKKSNGNPEITDHQTLFFQKSKVHAVRPPPGFPPKKPKNEIKQLNDFQSVNTVDYNSMQLSSYSASTQNSTKSTNTSSNSTPSDISQYLSNDTSEGLTLFLKHTLGIGEKSDSGVVNDSSLKKEVKVPDSETITENATRNSSSKNKAPPVSWIDLDKAESIRIANELTNNFNNLSLNLDLRSEEGLKILANRVWVDIKKHGTTINTLFDTPDAKEIFFKKIPKSIPLYICKLEEEEKHKGSKSAANDTNNARVGNIEPRFFHQPRSKKDRMEKSLEKLQRQTQEVLKSYEANHK